MCQLSKGRLARGRASATLPFPCGLSSLPSRHCPLLLFGGSSTSFGDPGSLITTYMIHVFRWSNEGSLIHLVPPSLRSLPCSLINKFCFFSVNSFVCCGVIHNETLSCIKPAFHKNILKPHTHTHWIVVKCYSAILHNDECGTRSPLPFETSLYVAMGDALLTLPFICRVVTTWTTCPA